MEPNPGRELPVLLRFLQIPACPDGLAPVVCLCCRNPLDIHQPDPEVPDRMLATCPECRSWHLIDCASGPDEVLIVLLPDVAPFHQALRPGKLGSRTQGTEAPRP